MQSAELVLPRWIAKGSGGIRRGTVTLFCTTLDYLKAAGTGVTPGLRSMPGWPVKPINLVGLVPGLVGKQV